MIIGGGSWNSETKSFENMDGVLSAPELIEANFFEAHDNSTMLISTALFNDDLYGFHSTLSLDANL